MRCGGGRVEREVETGRGSPWEGSGRKGGEDSEFEQMSEFVVGRSTDAEGGAESEGSLAQDRGEVEFVVVEHSAIPRRVIMSSGCSDFGHVFASNPEISYTFSVKRSRLKFVTFLTFD